MGVMAIIDTIQHLDNLISIPNAGLKLNRIEIEGAECCYYHLVSDPIPAPKREISEYVGGRLFSLGDVPAVPKYEAYSSASVLDVPGYGGSPETSRSVVVYKPNGKLMGMEYAVERTYPRIVVSEALGLLGMLYQSQVQVRPGLAILYQSDLRWKPVKYTEHLPFSAEGSRNKPVVFDGPIDGHGRLREFITRVSNMTEWRWGLAVAPLDEDDMLLAPPYIIWPSRSWNSVGDLVSIMAALVPMFDSRIDSYLYAYAFIEAMSYSRVGDTVKMMRNLTVPRAVLLATYTRHTYPYAFDQLIERHKPSITRANPDIVIPTFPYTDKVARFWHDMMNWKKMDRMQTAVDSLKYLGAEVA